VPSVRGSLVIADLWLMSEGRRKENCDNCVRLNVPHPGSIVLCWAYVM
jgi:hypothetical protein